MKRPPTCGARSRTKAPLNAVSGMGKQGGGDAGPGLLGPFPCSAMGGVWGRRTSQLWDERHFLGAFPVLSTFNTLSMQWG